MRLLTIANSQVHSVAQDNGNEGLAVDWAQFNNKSCSILETTVHVNAGLVSMIAFNNGHFINFSKRAPDNANANIKKWYLFDDHEYKQIGDFNKVLAFMISKKYTPYILMYEILKVHQKQNSLPKIEEVKSMYGEDDEDKKSEDTEPRI